MSFDSSRFTADPWNNFLGVVMEQGRVQLDSDWNEWQAEFLRRIQVEALDVIGQAGVPSTTKDGFLITATMPGGKVSIDISPGRIYVDGILAENHGLPTPNPAKWIPASDAVPEAAYPDWDRALDELVGSGNIDYNSQPYYPNPAPFPQSGGPYVIYVDVWQREVTFLEDADLIEKAVGVDTTGRLQTIWQVKWLDVSKDGSGITCTSDLPEWDALLLPPGPRLTTGVASSAVTGPCCLTSNSGFTGQENQLYRVEIHQPGKAISGTAKPPVSGSPGIATFKWSRDNASVATGVTAITQGGTVLTVQSTGKDSVLRFSPNDWVEITDDWLELNGLPGELHQVKTVSDTAKTITLTSAVSSSSFPVDAKGQTTPSRHTRVTRWDQGGKIFESDNTTVWADLTLPGATGDIPVPPPGTILILENGITIAFDLASGGAPFVSGQDWCFAARTADGTVEYLDKAPPRGIHHHYARLALLTPPGPASDCRTVFPPLTGLPSGDGCCCCSVTVGDGKNSKGDFTDIQKAIDSVANAKGPVEVCLLQGTFTLKTTVNITTSNLTLRGCPQSLILFQGTDPAIKISPGNAKSITNVTLEDLNIQASFAVEVILGEQISILDCTFAAAKAPVASGFLVVAQAQGFEFRGNQLTGGGVWTVDGSAQVAILENTIADSAGPGVGLGGFAAGIDFNKSAAGVVGGEVSSNQISGAASSGITTVMDSEAALFAGDIEDVSIERNTITGCCQAPPTQPFGQAATAGVFLQHATTIRIQDNEIAENGSADLPCCGVYADDTLDLDVSNNRIINNGASSPGNVQSKGQQAGVYATNIGESMTVRDNKIRMPAGPALQIVAKAPMAIENNILESFGYWRTPFGPALRIENLGFPLEVGKAALGALEFTKSKLGPSGLSKSTDFTLKDGRTLVLGNQVSFLARDGKANTMPCVLLSLDDLAIEDNQFQATLPTQLGILTDVFALAAFSLRAIGNRFSEVPGTAIMSLLGAGQWNIVNLNQATHCVIAVGTNSMTSAFNQVMIPNLCKDLEHLFGA